MICMNRNQIQIIVKFLINAFFLEVVTMAMSSLGDRNVTGNEVSVSSYAFLTFCQSPNIMKRLSSLLFYFTTDRSEVLSLTSQ